MNTRHKQASSSCASLFVGGRCFWGRFHSIGLALPRCRSEQQGFLPPSCNAGGLFPPSGGWPSRCACSVWPHVPFSKQQNLYSQHSLRNKVNWFIYFHLCGFRLKVSYPEHIKSFYCCLYTEAFIVFSAESSRLFNQDTCSLIWQHKTMNKNVSLAINLAD